MTFFNVPNFRKKQKKSWDSVGFACFYFLSVKNTSTDIFLCPKLFPSCFETNKRWEIEKLCNILKSEGKNVCPNIFFVQIFKVVSI